MCSLGEPSDEQDGTRGQAFAASSAASGRLLRKSVAQAEVARRVGVVRTTVSEWNEKLEDRGARGAEAPATGSTGWARIWEA